MAKQKQRGYTDLREIIILAIMTDIDIYLKLATLPEHLKKEVIDFVDFLKSRVKDENVSKKPRKAGLAKGLIEMREDFDEPLEDFKDYME